MSEKNIKKIGIKQDTGEYVYVDIGVDANNVDIDETTNLIDKLAEIDTKANNNPYYTTSSTEGYGSSGYVAFARLQVKSTYQNSPIEFEMICRGRKNPCRVSIQFNGGNTVDPSVVALSYAGEDYGVFACKIATSIWELYYTKSEKYDMLTVTKVSQVYDSYIEVTHPGTYLSTKPTENVVNATLGYNVGSATQDGDGNVITSTYATKNVDIYGDTLGVNTTITVDEETTSFLKVIYADNKFVALGKSDMFYSINGKDWFRCQGATEKNVKDGVLVWTPNGFVAIILHNQYGYLHCIKSVDGINWTSSTYIVNSGLADYHYYYTLSCAYGNETIVFTGASRSSSNVSESFVYYSNDYGETWTKKLFDNASGLWKSIIYDNGIFMSVSTWGGYMYSSDGINWTIKNSSEATKNDVIYIADIDMFVAVGDGKVIYGSGNNYFSFSKRITNASSLQHIRYVNGYCVIYDANGNIFYSKISNSITGSQWTQSVTINANPSSIAYNNHKFVIVNKDNNNIDLYSFNKTSSDIEDAINSLVHRDDLVKKTSILSTVTECQASTNPTDIAGASALAELNDSLSDVETFELIPVNGVTFTTNQCFYNKATKRVDILAECTCATAIASNAKFAAVPTKYTPSQGMVSGLAFKVNNIAGAASIGVFVYNSGNIAQGMTSGMTHLQFSLSYYC